MRIGLEHIDPQIAAAMRERLCAPGANFLRDHIRWADTEEASLIRLFMNQTLRRVEQRQPEEVERHAYVLHRQRERMAKQRAWIAVAGSLIGAALLGMMFYTLMGALWIGIVVGALIGIGGLIGGGWWAWQATPAHELFYEVTHNEFMAVVPLLPLTKMEAVYCDLLTEVCAHDPNQEARRAVRRHISRLKELVALGRKLETLADTAAQDENTALHDEIEVALEDLTQALQTIQGALCEILVVPSQAGDYAAERIENELQAKRRIVENLTAAVAAQTAPTGKRRRAKVS